MEQYFESLANKCNSQEHPFLYFLEYDPKEMRVLTNLIFSFGLADDQKSFNGTCNYVFLHFCTTIMDFFIILKCSVFFLPGRALLVKYHLCWICTSNKNKALKTINFHFQPYSRIHSGANFEIIFRQK